jgi:hypothetical protein
VQGAANVVSNEKQVASRQKEANMANMANVFALHLFENFKGSDVLARDLGGLLAFLLSVQRSQILDLESMS